MRWRFPSSFNIFFMYDIQHCFICRPSDSTVSEDAGIEPRTVADTTLAVCLSNHSARSHPYFLHFYTHNNFLFAEITYLLILKMLTEILLRIPFIVWSMFSSIDLSLSAVKMRQIYLSTAVSVWFYWITDSFLYIYAFQGKLKPL